MPADAVVEQEDVNDEDERPSILVVDDDVEIVRYLKTLLGQTYRVRSRFDADGALQAIAKQEPATRRTTFGLSPSRAPIATAR